MYKNKTYLLLVSRFILLIYLVKDLSIMKFFWFVIFLVQFIVNINAKWVRDVDSKIVEEIKQNPSIAYLIKFHAPWLVNKMNSLKNFS